MSYLAQSQTSNRKLVAFGAAVIIHAFLGYALVSGLANKVMKKLNNEVEAVNVEQEKPKEEPPPPPPEKVVEIPVVTPPPIINVQTDAPPPPITTVTTTYIPPPAAAPVAVAPVPAPVAAPPAPKAPPAAAVNATPRGKKQDWFSNDDYPSSASRANEEGTTYVRVVVNEQGRIESCTITKSSGSQALDDTTCRLYPRRAKYNPAKAEGGVAIKQTIDDRVVWKLPKE